MYSQYGYIPPSNDIVHLTPKMLRALADIPNPRKRHVSLEEYRGRHRIVFASVNEGKGGDNPCWQVCQNGKLKEMKT